LVTISLTKLILSAVISELREGKSIALEMQKELHTPFKQTQSFTEAATSLKQEFAYRKKAEEQFRVLLESLPDAMVIVDSSGKIVLINAQTENLFGYNREELIGRSVEKLVPERFATGHLQHRAGYLQQPKSRPMGAGTDLLALHKSGKEFPVEISLSPLHTEEGLFVIAAVRDASEQRQARKALQASEENARRAYSELQKMNEQMIQNEKTQALGQMAAGVAHQFNNILMAISGMTDLAMLNLANRDKAQEYLKKVKISSTDAANIVQRLQEFSRRIPRPTPKPISVNDVLTSSIQVTQPKWKNEAEKLGVYIDIKTELQQVPPVLGIESELREVIVNLIINATDSMYDVRGGTISLRTAQRDNNVVITISDTGIGMSPETLSKIFVPFFSTKLERGTGLGLAICHNIITRMGGKIEVESSEREGSTFTILLPAAPTSADASEKDTTSIRRASPANILIIDDEPPICDIIQGFLELQNHKTVAYRNPVEAVQSFKERPFDLVITDLGMEPLSGWEVINQIKSTRPATKTLLLTGWGDTISSDEAALKGADMVISKPIDYDKLLKAIDRLLSK
jgi:PAS domain S-box-containing protein